MPNRVGEMQMESEDMGKDLYGKSIWWQSTGAREQTRRERLCIQMFHG